ncbi:hypothetical protein FK742_003744 [Escherichia coli]|nr:hypothetical protein [Escherichia coli]
MNQTLPTADLNTAGTTDVIPSVAIDLRIPLYSITDWHRSPISDSHPFDQPGT